LGAVTGVVNVNPNLRQTCHQGDLLRIITRPERRDRSSFALGQRIEKEDGTVAADTVVTLAMIDPTTRRNRLLPQGGGGGSGQGYAPR